MRKRRTREHEIADLSVNHVERHVLHCGWTVERKRNDYGLDLVMESYGADGEVENGWVLFQLKATENLKRSADGKTIPFRLHWRDLLFWLNDAQPVILVVYEAAEDRAYWLYVQEYFRQETWAEWSGSTRSVTVRIPIENILDEAAVRRFASFRDEAASDN